MTDEKETESIEPYRYQLREWKKLLRFLPKTNDDRDDAFDVGKLIENLELTIQTLEFNRQAARSLILNGAPVDDVFNCLALTDEELAG